METGPMSRRSGVLIALLFILAAMPASLRDVAPARDAALTIDPAIGPAIEAQIRTVERLTALKTADGRPDPQLFGALSRLEEMLPRSAATRRAQERGRRLYTAMVASRSTRLARQWPRLRAEIESAMRS